MIIQRNYLDILIENLLYSLELISRIAKAQSMDILTSTGFIAGYSAVILVASNDIYDVNTCALIAPAKVLVIGAGIAGLSCSQAQTLLLHVKNLSSLGKALYDL